MTIKFALTAIVTSIICLVLVIAARLLVLLGAALPLGTLLVIDKVAAIVVIVLGVIVGISVIALMIAIEQAVRNR